MESFLVAVNTILPLFLLMASGYAVKRLKLISDQTEKQMNSIIFKLFLPVLLCNNILSASDMENISPSIFLYALLGISGVFLLAFLIVPLLEKDPKKRAVLIQGVARSNYALFGVPVVGYLFPGQDTALASLMVLATVPTYNIFSVIALEINQGQKANPGKILLSVIKNPLIIGCLAGFLLIIIKIQLPPFLLTGMSEIGKIASPLALFLLGVSFEFSRVGKNKKQLAIGVVGKLVVVPLLGMTGGILLGFRGVALASLMVAFASPTAVSSYPMAIQMGADGELAGQQVVFSSAFSIITMFLCIFFLKYFGLF